MLNLAYTIRTLLRMYCRSGTVVRNDHFLWGSCSCRYGSFPQGGEVAYVDLSARYICEPIVVETLGVFSASARHLPNDLGRRSSLNSGEARETSFLYQRISILVQCFNAVLLHDSLLAVDSTDWRSYPLFSLLI